MLYYITHEKYILNPIEHAIYRHNAKYSMTCIYWNIASEYRSINRRAQ